ncbi:MAG: hypothetical protein IE878_06760 [Epsilonproteobacteria bacterium]|nr:hypothetical protein [Campylobacterota bacterium]MBD3840066.1 hypothetical protein [Campylobacterota bacterium]
MNEDISDIKPLLEIEDSSFTIFIIVVFIFTSIALFLLYIFIKSLWLKRSKNRKKIAFKELENIDWSNAKEASYKISKLGKELMGEDRRIAEIYEQTLRVLERYKYKKESPQVDDETLKQYNLLVHVIHESL